MGSQTFILEVHPMGLLKPLRHTVLQKIIDTIEDVYFY